MRRSTKTTEFLQASAINKRLAVDSHKPPAAEVLLSRMASSTGWQPKIEDKRVAKICQTDGSLDPGYT
jgi:hypothetical protein